jgi:hypothetical protein
MERRAGRTGTCMSSRFPKKLLAGFELPQPSLTEKHVLDRTGIAYREPLPRSYLASDSAPERNRRDEHQRWVWQAGSCLGGLENGKGFPAIGALTKQNWYITEPMRFRLVQPDLAVGAIGASPGNARMAAVFFPRFLAGSLVRGVAC